MNKLPEFFDIERDGVFFRLPLSQMTANEVLGIANGLLRANRKKEAQDLYRLQHAMREGNNHQPTIPSAA